MSIFFTIQFFLIGFLLVDIFLLDWKAEPAKGVAWDIISGLCWLGLVPVLRFGLYPGFVIPALIFLAYVGAFRGRVLSRLLSSRFFVVCGGMCYTLYLYHGKVIYAIMPKLMHVPRTGNLAIDVPIYTCLAYVPILAICSLMFVLIEKPCMRPDWPQRFYAFITRKPMIT